LVLVDGVPVGLDPAVEVAGRGDARLEAVLHVPDRDAAGAGDGLRGAAERALQRGDQAVVVALVDRGAGVARERRLARRLSVGVQTDTAEEALAAAARPEGGADAGTSGDAP